jgi:hypothetical protein
MYKLVNPLLCKLFHSNTFVHSKGHHLNLMVVFHFNANIIHVHDKLDIKHSNYSVPNTIHVVSTCYNVASSHETKNHSEMWFHRVKTKALNSV